MFASGDSHEDSNGASSSSPFTHFFFSGGLNSSVIDHIFFLVSIPSHAGAPHIHSLLAIHLLRSVQDISKIRVSTLHSVNLFQDWYLIQAI